MRTTTDRLAQIYLLCLVVILIGMTIGGCGTRRYSACQGPYTVHSRPAGCSAVPYANAPQGSITINPASRYWHETNTAYNPYYSQGWYHSEVPYGRNYRHRHFGTAGINGY